MKKLLLTLFFCLITTVCFAPVKPAKIATLQKVVGKAQFTCTLGEDNDLVKIGKDTDMLTLSPRIEFSKWNGEEKLGIEYEGLSASVPTVKDGIVEIGNSEEGFYYKRTDDENFKFGTVWNKKPLTNKVSFRLSGWENFEFRQIPKEHLNKPINEEYIGGWNIVHKNKRDNFLCITTLS